MIRDLSRPSANRWGTIAIITLLVVNFVLLGLALRARTTSQVPAAGAGDTRPSVPPPSTATPSGAASTPSPSPSRTAAAEPLLLLVSAVSANVAWRVASGTCGARPRTATVEMSSDGGRTWAGAGLTVSTVTRLTATSARRAFVVAASSRPGSCVPALRSTSGNGWSTPSDASAAWYRSTSEVTRIAVPGARTARPCGRLVSVVDLQPDGPQQAAALCADDRVVQTSDAGNSWRRVGAVPGAVALAVQPDGTGYLVAALGVPGCPGVAVIPVGADTPTACVNGSAAPPEPGRVAISTAQQATWLLVGQSAYVSTAGASAFRRRSG